MSLQPTIGLGATRHAAVAQRPTAPAATRCAANGHPAVPAFPMSIGGAR